MPLSRRGDPAFGPPPELSGGSREKKVEMLPSEVLYASARVLVADLPNISPSSSGLPGSAALTSLAGGLEWWALLAALVGIVLGAATWALGAHSNNWQHAASGRRAVLVSAAAALIIGAAPAVLNFLYASGTGVGHP